MMTGIMLKDIEAKKGDRGFVYEDKGTYAKGHNTNGHHNIHKLNEYKKRQTSLMKTMTKLTKKTMEDSRWIKHLVQGLLEKPHMVVMAFYKVDMKAGGFDGFYDNGASYSRKGGDKAFKNFGYYNKGYY
ncbi:hypothetical protein NQ318_000487 [Aromia moschata]|uniref:Uncharacterized protein n=1 Tax=Aromia moschata TaxID=1265417 RepID=A0AAV8YEN2_9CUCU|nr:hypothetical protein NQ318_000487 [Aromia moschata]